MSKKDPGVASIGPAVRSFKGVNWGMDSPCSLTGVSTFSLWDSSDWCYPSGLGDYSDLTDSLGASHTLEERIVGLNTTSCLDTLEGT